jgi:hypothetical protein
MPIPLRPRVRGTLLPAKALHPHGLSKKDHKRSSAGLLKGKAQQAVSVMPSIALYLSQMCGVSLLESVALVRARRLYAGGQPLQGTRALEVQVPSRFISQLDLEIVTLHGLRVPALERRHHRYYGLHHLVKGAEPTADEASAKSFFLPIRKLETTSDLPRPRWAESEAVQQYASVPNFQRPPFYADGLDQSSSPVLIRAPGMRPTMSGLAILTNDVSMPMHFAAVFGHSGTFVSLLRRGTPEDLATRLVTELTTALQHVRSPMLGDSAASFAVELLQLPESQCTANALLDSGLVGGVDGSPTSSKEDPLRTVVKIDATYLPKKARALLRDVAPEFTKVTRCGGFHLAGCGLPLKCTRRMTDSEVETLFADERRRKTLRVVGQLRDSLSG